MKYVPGAESACGMMARKSRKYEMFQVMEHLCIHKPTKPSTFTGDHVMVTDTSRHSYCVYRFSMAMHMNHTQKAVQIRSELLKRPNGEWLRANPEAYTSIGYEPTPHYLPPA